MPSTGSDLEGKILQDGGTCMSPTARAPQLVLLAGWVTRLHRVPASASSLCFWGLRSFGQQQRLQGPHHTGQGDQKDRLQRCHLHPVLHCNLQTSRAASSNCNHFSSLNFCFQCLNQASLGLAASVVPFGVG